MYELVLRIDVGEVANSSFHQTQRESELSDVFSFFFFLSFMELSRICRLGQKAPE